ncbi:MAG: CpaF family protein [Cyanobacteriota bacterium]
MSLRDRLSRSSDVGKRIDTNWVKKTQEDQVPAEITVLPKEYQHIKDKIHYMLIERVNSIPDWDNYEEEDKKLSIRSFVDKRLEIDFTSTPLNRQEKEQLIREVIDETMGYGPLEPLLADSTVSDILVNGAKHIYVERYGKLYKTNATFRDDSHLMNIIDRIVAKVGRRIDEKSPMVDARLQDGSRVNAIIPPLALDGPSLSIRKFKQDAATLDNLLRWGSMTTQMAEVLCAAVKARLNIIISGGTGAGKTTLLNSLSAQIPEDERIVTIEDSAELILQQEHVVRLETRPPNIEGEGAVTARDLVINSLRMRPDRVVIGECRGAEALDMLQAMNTGHDGSLTTLHANTPRDALGRLETMVMFSGVELPERTIRTQVSSAVDLIVQASRLGDGSRRVTYITEVVGMEGLTITLQDIFIWHQEGVDSEGKVIGYHKATGVRPKFSDRAKSRGISMAPELFDPNNDPNYLCPNPPNAYLKQSKSVMDDPVKILDTSMPGPPAPTAPKEKAADPARNLIQKKDDSKSALARRLKR